MIFILFLAGIAFVNGSDKNCTAFLECKEETYSCTAGEECNIDCGEQACKSGIFYCADGHDCNVNCNFGWGACAWSVIHCPKNASCNIDCSYEYACSSVDVFGGNLSNSVVVSGCDTFSNCLNLRLDCPIDGEYGDCYIGGEYGTDDMDLYLSNMDFEDVILDFTSAKINRTDDPGDVYCKNGTSKITVNLTLIDGDCFTLEIANYTNVIDCRETPDYYEGIYVNGIPYDPSCYSDSITCSDDGSCYIACGDKSSCEEANIQCADDYGCYVNCGMGNRNKRRTCWNATIDCPENGDCIVDCNAGGGGCRYSTINARKSNSLSILGCSPRSENDTLGICEDMIIWCPEDGRCYLEGDQNLNGLQIWIDSNETHSFDNLVFNFTGDKEDKLGDIYCQYSNSKHSCSIESLDPLECKGSCTGSGGKGNGGGGDSGDSANQLSAIANVFCFVIVAFIWDY